MKIGVRRLFVKALAFLCISSVWPFHTSQGQGDYIHPVIKQGPEMHMRDASAPLESGPAYDRVALIIGEGVYDHIRDLSNPPRDASGVAQALQSVGFDVEVHLNLAKAPLEQVLEAFQHRAVQAEIAIIYYAGHGVEVDGINYFIPTDAQLCLSCNFPHEVVNISVATHVVGQASRLGLLLLDTCRDNPFDHALRNGRIWSDEPDSMPNTDTSTSSVALSASSRGLGRARGDRAVYHSNLLIGYAAAPGGVADDGAAGGNSPYAHAFIEVLNEPRREVDRLLGGLRDKVINITSGRQVPYIEGTLGEKVVYLQHVDAMHPSHFVQPIGSFSALGPPTLHLESESD